jgi:hypothetical protein
VRRYSARVAASISGCVPVVYVTDVEQSAVFYALLGFSEQDRGEDGEWRWSYLKSGEVGVLLAAGGSVWSGDPGPILPYLRVPDLDAIERALVADGARVERMGYPAHAPGGEMKVLDPDGHGILVGQVTGTAPHGVDAETEQRTSILARAATAMHDRARHEAPSRCQFPRVNGLACSDAAQVKLADSWGDSVWTCVAHADEILINATGTYIASHDSEGLAAYLRRRQADA